jgi:hypothetical protein
MSRERLRELMKKHKESRNERINQKKTNELNEVIGNNNNPSLSINTPKPPSVFKLALHQTLFDNNNPTPNLTKNPFTPLVMPDKLNEAVNNESSTEETKQTEEEPILNKDSTSESQPTSSIAPTPSKPPMTESTPIIPQTPSKPPMTELTPTVPQTPSVAPTPSRQLQTPVVPPTPSKPLQTPVVEPTPSKPLQTPVVPPTPSKPLQTPVVPPTPSKPLQTPVVAPTPSKPLQTPVVPPTPSKPLQTPVVPPTPSKPLQTPVVAPTPSRQLQTPVVEQPQMVEQEKLDGKSMWVKLIKKSQCTALSSDVIEGCKDLIHEIIREMCEYLVSNGSNSLTVDMIHKYISVHFKKLQIDSQVTENADLVFPQSNFYKFILPILNENKVVIKPEYLFVLQMYIEYIIVKILNGAEFVKDGAKRKRVIATDLLVAYQIYTMH